MNGCSLVQVCAFCIMSAYSSNFCETDFIFHGLELPIEYYHKPNSPKLSLTELEELLGTPFMSGIHILLAHNPKYGNTYLSWGADLVLSGHYHGGILRFGENHGARPARSISFFRRIAAADSKAAKARCLSVQGLESIRYRSVSTIRGSFW